MVKVTNLCTDCVQIITNPICPNCFSKHVLIWLRDKKISYYQMNSIKNLLNNLVKEAEETPSETKCILCDSRKVNICIYCFTNKARRILEKKAPTIINEFKEDFNTAIWRI